MTIYIYTASSVHPFCSDVLQLCICSAHLLDGPPSSKYMNSQNVYAMKIINNSLEHSYMTEKGKNIVISLSAFLYGTFHKLYACLHLNIVLVVVQ